MDYATRAMPHNATVEKFCVYFTKEQCEVLTVTKDVFASVTLVAITITLVMAFLLDKYKRFCHRTVIEVLVFEAVYMVVMMSYNAESKTPACVVQGFCMQLFGHIPIFLLCAQSIYIFIRINFDKETEKFEWLYTILAIVPVIILSSMPFINQVYGPSGPWCWITGNDSENHDQIYRFTIGWGPMIAAFLIVLMVFLYLYIKSVWLTRRYIGGQHNDFLQQRRELMAIYLKPFFGLALSFLLLTLVMCGNRLYDLVYYKKSFIYSMIMTIGFTLRGTIFSATFYFMHGRKEIHVDVIKRQACIKWSFIKHCGKLPELDSPVIQSNSVSNGLEDSYTSSGGFTQYGSIRVPPQ